MQRPCQLLQLPRASFYYQAHDASEGHDTEVMHRLDEQYTKTPFYGSRRMTVVLREQGYPINRKRVARLMRQMGLEALYAKPNLSLAHPEHQKYPYLLRGLSIERPNQVWSMDITYIKLRGGFLYLVAVLDWYSRYVVAWELSNSLETSFCIEAFERAARKVCPEILNTDQGVQFTSRDFVARVLAKNVRVSMDGRGRAFDNIFVERLWRTVKYEEVYLKDYADGHEAYASLYAYFIFYNEERPHQALGYQRPKDVYTGVAKRAVLPVMIEGPAATP